MRPNKKSQSEEPKRTFRRYFLTLLGLGLVTTLVPWYMFRSLTRVANEGVSGTEYLGLTVLPVLYGGYIICLIALVVLPLWLRKYRPGRGYLMASIVVMILAAGYLAVAVRDNMRYWQAYNKADKVASKTEAIELVKSCQGEAVYESADAITTDPTASRESAIVLGPPAAGEARKGYQVFAKRDFKEVAQAAYRAYEECGDTAVHYETSRDLLDYPLNVSQAEAIKLIDSCSIMAVFWRDDGVLKGRGKDAAFGDSGVAYDYADRPAVLWLHQSSVGAILPVIENARKTCGDIHVFHNYKYDSIFD